MKTYTFTFEDLGDSLRLIVRDGDKIDSIFEMPRRRHDRAYLQAFANRSLGLGLTRVGLDD
jgi:hypothetical protein